MDHKPSCYRGRPNACRVLIVDNDPRERAKYGQLTQMWGYHPVIADGFGDQLVLSATELAASQRCHVALLDAQLRNDEDRWDDSGLALIPLVEPARAVVIGYTLPALTVTQAIGARAIRCLDKEQRVTDLEAALAAAACYECCRSNDAVIELPDGCTVESIAHAIYPDANPDVAGEVACVLGQLFPAAKHVALEVITGVDASTGPTRGAPRQRSVVFRATVDDEAALRVVKIARSVRVSEEVRRYGKHILRRLPFHAYPLLESQRVLWDIGGVAYEFIGGDGGSRPAATFARYFAEQDNLEDLAVPLRRFFGNNRWGDLYDREGRTVGTGSLVEAYDQCWENQLCESFDEWRAQPEQVTLPGFPIPVPNPGRWLVANLDRCLEVPWKEAVTHGDLHADNLFVDEDRHPFPIDFERTGRGPILRDEAELIQDVLTRLVDHGPGNLTLMYESAVSLCSPLDPDHVLPLTPGIRDHASARRGHHVAQVLVQMACGPGQCVDLRELLWAVLVDCLFVSHTVNPGGDRWLRTALLAATLCQRLERWPEVDWLPPSWPPVRWLEPEPPAVAAA